MSEHKRYFVVEVFRYTEARGRQVQPLVDRAEIERLRVVARSAFEHTQQLFAKIQFPLELVQIDLADDHLAPPWHRLRDAVRADAWWKEARGRYSNTIDIPTLARRTRVIAEDALNREDYLLIVTNQELTPPPEWRYIISDNSLADRYAVVSARPMDPVYWSEPVEERFDIIYRRLRAILCALIGEFQGLSSCENQRCFMFSPVLSVAELDDMRGFGPEHRIHSISDVGFSSDRLEATQVINKSFEELP